MIRTCTISDIDEMVSIHQQHFLRGWSREELVQLLNEPGCFCFVYDGEKQCAGFILFRLVADEAEILTLVIDESQKRKGIATALLECSFHVLAEKRAHSLFLEVAEDNSAALQLYEKIGFLVNGRRRGYYPRLGRTRADALLMHKIMQPVAHFS